MTFRYVIFYKVSLASQNNSFFIYSICIMSKSQNLGVLGELEENVRRKVDSKTCIVVTLIFMNIFHQLLFDYIIHIVFLEQ